MLTQLTSRLASQLNDLTIQVVKEDWTLTSPLATSPPASSLFPPPLPPPAATSGGYRVPNPYLPATATTTTTTASSVVPTFDLSAAQDPRLQMLGAAQEADLTSSPSAREDTDYPTPHPSHSHSANRQHMMMAQGQEGQFVGRDSGAGEIADLNSNEHKHHSLPQHSSGSMQVI